MTAVVIMVAWQWLPFATLIFMTALQSMDREQLEAARMDGAHYGQQLRYRNGAAAWTDFVWPNPGANPGVRVSGLSHEGKRLEFLDIAGAFGLERMLQSAKVTRLGNGISELSWTQGSATLSVQLRLVRSPGSAASDTAGRGGGSGLQGLRGLRLPAAVVGLERPRDAQSGQPS